MNQIKIGILRVYSTDRAHISTNIQFRMCLCRIGGVASTVRCETNDDELIEEWYKLRGRCKNCDRVLSKLPDPKQIPRVKT